MPEAQNKIDLEVSSNEVLNTPIKSITNQEIPKTLTPTTRKKKSCLADLITLYIDSLQLTKEDEKAVLKPVLAKGGLLY